MTLDETRLLGIEFERRIQTMMPSTEFIGKLDSETIYSYLNQYLDEYIQGIYRSLDKIPSGTKLSADIESALQSLIVRAEEIKDNAVYIDNDLNKIIYKLPENFGRYLHSTSKVNCAYQFKDNKGYKADVKFLNNQLVSQNDAIRFTKTAYDTIRILRNPIAVLDTKDDKPVLSIMYDIYTQPTGVEILYYKIPNYFGILTDTPCELPMSMFDTLVTGAVELYIQYVAGAEANRRRQQEDAQRQAEQNNKQNNQNENHESRRFDRSV